MRCLKSAPKAGRISSPDVYGEGALIEDFETRVADMLDKPAALTGVRVNPETPQTAMFHLHIELARDRLIQAVDEYAAEHDVIVLPKPRAVDESGSAVCEISVGRSTMEHPPRFWLAHLRAALTVDAPAEAQ